MHATGGEKEMVTSVSRLVDENSDLGLLLKTMAEVFLQADNLTATDDFLNDLGCHSLLAATLVSRVRKESPPWSTLKHLGLQDIYVYRTAEKIAERVSEEKQDVFPENKRTPSLTLATDRWLVSRRRYILCGLAQLPALILLFFITSLSLIGPYLIFYVLL